MEENTLKHLSILMDGNRRWAKARGLPSLEGHRQGANNAEQIMTKARELGVKCLSLWAFSTENWKRTPEEVNFLFNLFREMLAKYHEKFLKEKTRFVHIGRKDRLPKDMVDQLISLEEETKDFPDFTVCLCMDYGGHDEIVRAVDKLLKEGKNVTEENIERALDTSYLPNPDFIIRTGGEVRLSGFMSWQSAYAEYYFTEKPFPDFGPQELEQAVDSFYKRERRFGGDSPVVKPAEISHS